MSTFRAGLVEGMLAPEFAEIVGFIGKKLVAGAGFEPATFGL
jgi:hypothetical protein